MEPLKLAPTRRPRQRHDPGHLRILGQVGGVDQFGVRRGAGEMRVETSSDIAEDGVTADTYAADEPWTPAPRNSFDEAVKEMACGEKEPSRAPFETIRAWIDAGRP